MSGRSSAIEARDLVSAEAEKAVKDLNKLLEDLLKTVDGISKINITISDGGSTGKAKEQISAYEKEINRLTKSLETLEAKHQVWAGMQDSEHGKMAKREIEQKKMLTDKHALQKKIMDNDTKNSADRIKQMMKERQEEVKQIASAKNLEKAMKGQAKTIKEATNDNKRLKLAREGVNTTTKQGQTQITKINNIIKNNNALIKKNTDLTKQNATQVKIATGKQKGLWDMIKKLSAVAAALWATSQITQYAKAIFEVVKAYDKMNFTMRTIIQDTYDLIGASGFLRDVVADLGLNLRVVTQQYVKFRAAAKASGITTLETEAIFRSFSKAAAVMGLRGDELKGVYLALEQMLSKGKVTTEELRRQLGERLPGAVAILAKSMGVTVAELDKMLKKGEVLSAEVLPRMAQVMEQEYKIDAIDQVHNLTAEMQRLTTSWELFVTTLVSSEGKVVRAILAIAASIGVVLDALTLMSEDDKQTGARVAGEEMQKVIDKQLDVREKGEERLIKLFEKGNVPLEQRNKLLEEYRKGQRKIARDAEANKRKELKDFDETNKIHLEGLQKKIKELQKESKVGAEIGGIIGLSLGAPLPDKAQAQIGIAGAIAGDWVEDMSGITDNSEQQLKLEKQITKIVKERAKIEGVIAAQKKLGEEPKSGASSGGVEDDGSGGYRDKIILEKQLIGLETKRVELASIRVRLLKIGAKDENNSLKVRLEYTKKLEVETDAMLDRKREKEIKQRENWVKREKERVGNMITREERALSKLVTDKKLTQEEADAKLKLLTAQRYPYFQKLEQDHLEWLTKINSDYNDQKVENERLTQMEIYKIMLHYQKRVNKMKDSKAKIGMNIELRNMANLYSEGGFFNKMFTDYYKDKDDFLRKALKDETKAIIIAKEQELSSLKALVEADADARGVAEGKGEVYTTKLPKGVDADAVKALELMLTEARKKLAELGVADVEDWVERFSKVLELTQTFVSDLGGILDAVHEHKMATIDAERQATEEQYERAIELAGNDSHQKEALAKEQKIADEKYEKDKRKLERDNAKRVKAQSLVEIAINTAVAVSRAPAEGVIASAWLIPLIIASGAMQAAAVAMQPLPALKDGRKGGKETYALLNDGGKQEVIETSSGAIGVPKGVNSVHWLNQGDSVHPSIEAYQASVMKKMSIKKNVTDKDIDAILLQKAIEEGFKKAKINNETTVNVPKFDINQKLWEMQQSQF